MSIYRSPFALSDPSPELLSLPPVESFSTAHKGIAIRTNTPYPPITKLPAIVLSNDLGFSEPTPIQAYAIPVIEHGHPALIRAPTGMGKTLCFLLPVIKNVRSNSHGIQLCVVVPTRELCEQIKAEGQKLLKKSDVKIKAVYGRQKERFSENGHAALLVATPGRLLDLLGKKTINFSSLKYFVLDEADRLLDMGFGEDLRAIRRFVPKEASVSLFSATYPDALKRIIDDFLPADRRVFVEVEQESVKNIEQRFVRPKDKREELLRILRECKLRGKSWKGDVLDRVIIFVEKKSTAGDLEEYLRKEGINCYALHGDKRQEERTTVMHRFRSGLFPVLVATSIAARGIDVKDVKLVVNFDLPKDIKDYVHRIGRTGREGKKGSAVSFLDSSVSPELIKDLMAVVEESGNEIPQLLQAKVPARRHGNGRGNRESAGPSRRTAHVPETESLSKKTASLSIKEKEEASDEDVMGGW